MKTLKSIICCSLVVLGISCSGNQQKTESKDTSVEATDSNHVGAINKRQQESVTYAWTKCQEAYTNSDNLKLEFFAKYENLLDEECKTAANSYADGVKALPAIDIQTATQADFDAYVNGHKDINKYFSTVFLSVCDEATPNELSDIADAESKVAEALHQYSEVIAPFNTNFGCTYPIYQK